LALCEFLAVASFTHFAFGWVGFVLLLGLLFRLLFW